MCAVDITVKSGGTRFDILNDAVGKVLITLGVLRLWAIPVAGSYRKGMGLVTAVSCLSTLKTVAREMGFQKPPDLEFLWTVWEFAEIGAVLLFCFAMRLLCRRTDLARPERSWSTTSILFLVFYALPVAGMDVMSLVSRATGQQLSIDVGSWAWIILVILLPWIHLFISTSRMKRAAQQAS